jgi:hypothetical protein
MLGVSLAPINKVDAAILCLLFLSQHIFEMLEPGAGKMFRRAVLYYV